MTRVPAVKICGVRDAAFARRAEELGAAYVGFIFAEKSPRRTTPAEAASAIARLEGSAKPAGVFVSTPAEEILAIARLAGLRVAQLHSERYSAEDVERLRDAGLETWKLARREPSAADGSPDAWLIDGFDGGRSGGTGKTGDWGLARRMAAEGLRVVLAGGISSANAADAAATGCAVLDVNSSLETSPGVKSVALLERFASATGFLK